MTTNGAPPPPARVQLTPGSWAGIAGIAVTLMIAHFAGTERVHDRIDGLGARLDGRIDSLALEVADVREQLGVMRGQLEVMRGQLERLLQRTGLDAADQAQD